MDEGFFGLLKEHRMNQWKQILQKVKGEVSTECYKTWFESTEAARVTADEILVRVPNKYYKEWITENPPISSRASSSRWILTATASVFWRTMTRPPTATCVRKNAGHGRARTGAAGPGAVESQIPLRYVRGRLQQPVRPRRLPWPWPSNHPRHTIRCIFTAGWAWARRT